MAAQIPSQKYPATIQQRWGKNLLEKCHLYLQSSINEDITNLIHCRSTLPFFSVHFSATEITRYEVNRYLSYLNSTKDKGHASDVIYLHRNPPKSWKPLPWRQEILGVVQIRGWYIQTRDSFFQSVFKQLRARPQVKTNKQKNPHQCDILRKMPMKLWRVALCCSGQEAGVFPSLSQ